VAMKTLYLLRHAKSDWNSDFATDHERGLSPRGIRATERMAKFLSGYGFYADLCISSTAVRCVDTWKYLNQNSTGFAREYREEPRLYEADRDSLLEMIQSVTNEVTSLVLVGHNPGLEELGEYLVIGDSVEDELHNPLFYKFPTSALLGLSLSVENWRDVSPGHASIIVYWIPGRKGISKRKAT